MDETASILATVCFSWYTCKCLNPMDLQCWHALGDVNSTDIAGKVGWFVIVSFACEMVFND